MPRPRCPRIVGYHPEKTRFNPEGEASSRRDTVVLGLDELEAMRLADLEGLYHQASGERMGVSRATFGRILQSAHRKIALALVEGYSLQIEGGAIKIVPTAGQCRRCARLKKHDGPCPFCSKHASGKGSDNQ